MPLPPKFQFQERQGRINWRTVLNTDVDKLVKDIDLRQLESLLQNLTYAQLDREDLERMGDAHFVKLFRLAQLSIEYLIYTQNYLETLTKTLDMQYKHTYEETEKVRDKIKQQTEENAIMKRELKLKQKTLTTYEYLLKMPAGLET
jgi:zinc finger protein DZIP1